jgi:hypothetical protein
MAYRFSYTPGELRDMTLKSRTNRIFKIVGVWCGFPGGVQKIELLDTDKETINIVKIDEFKKYVEEKDENNQAALTRI